MQEREYKHENINMMHESSTQRKNDETLSQKLPLNLLSLPLWHQEPKNYGSEGGTEAVVSGAEEHGVIKNYEVSSFDSELSG
jgi:hypothetical protein